ncbi:MAG: hypothetical protein M1821_008526 [Bathelium mastoideum]|nr:MAG: hypothetical protein M1821_008526 [Bathelium mastoideum]
MEPPRHRPPAQRRSPLATTSSSSRDSEDQSSSTSQYSANTMTPPPDKPLPPAPGRSSSTPPVARVPNRSSSIYSRATNFWGSPKPIPYEIESLPTDLFLQPSLYHPYSTSTPELITPQSSGQILEPRKYSPLIPSPSSSLSSSGLASPAPRPSILLPPTPAFPKSPETRRHVAKVSVSKPKIYDPVQSAEELPSALLPEEFRAAARGRPRHSSTASILDASSLPRPMSVVGPPQPAEQHARRKFSITSPGLGKQQHGLGGTRSRDDSLRSPDVQKRKHQNANSTSIGISTPLIYSTANEFDEPSKQIGKFQIPAGTTTDRTAMEKTKETGLFPPPLFSWRFSSHKKHSNQRSDGELMMSTIEAEASAQHGHRRRFGSLTGGGPLSTLMGNHRRRSTSGTIPISPPLPHDFESIPAPDGLPYPPISPYAPEIAHWRSSIPRDFAFSPPATLDVPPTAPQPVSPKRPNDPQPVLPPPKIVPLPLPIPPPPPFPPPASQLRRPPPPLPATSRSTKPRPTISHPKPIHAFPPLNPDELALASASAAKWGDSLSGHRPCQPLRFASAPALRTKARKGGESHGRNAKQSTAAAAEPKRSAAAATLFGALGMGKGGSAGRGDGSGARGGGGRSVGGERKAPAMSVAQVAELGSTGGTERVKGPMERYPTVGYGDVAGRAPRGVPRAGGDRSKVGVGGGKGGVRGAKEGEAGEKPSRKEKREERRRAELKSSIRVVGSGDRAGWI